MSIFYIFRHFKFIKILFNNDKVNRNNYHYLKIQERGKFKPLLINHLQKHKKQPNYKTIYLK